MLVGGAFYPILDRSAAHIRRIWVYLPSRSSTIPCPIHAVNCLMLISTRSLSHFSIRARPWQLTSKYITDSSLHLPGDEENTTELIDLSKPSVSVMAVMQTHS